MPRNKIRDRIRNTWHNMRRRCYDQHADSYKYYGEKGIEICDEWLYSFESFYEWSLNNGYSDDLTIDRINNNKSYSPNNCRWVSMKQQDNNRSNTIYITFKGICKSLPEWADELQIPQYVIRNRLNRNWSVEDALTRKVGKYEYHV